MHVQCRRKVQKMDGRMESKADAEWWYKNLIYSTLNKVIWEISVQYVKERRRKVRKTVYFQYSKSQKGHFSYKNWCPLTTLEVDLYYSKTKSCAKFQLNMSKHVMEKCGKLYLQYSKFEKRHNSKIGANWRHSNLICSTEKQSNMQTFRSICERV